MASKTPWLIFASILAGLGLMVFVAAKKPGNIIPPQPIPSPTSTPTINVTVVPEQKISTEDKMTNLAQTQLRLNQDELLSRGLLPSDLGVSGYSWSFSVNTGWNTIVDSSIGNKRYVAITGVTYTGSNITQIKIHSGGSLAEIWDIESLGAFETPHYIDTTPTIMSEDDGVKIEVYAKASGTESIIFDGIVVEKKGMTV